MPPLAVHRSRSQIPEFRLLRPIDLAEACMMQADEPFIVPFAGGIDLVNGMKEGVAPASLMMLSGIADLAAVRYDAADHLLELGAMARHDDIANSDAVRAHLPDVAACWDRIANIRIRMQGTVAGNLLAGIPGYEGSALLSALGASVSVWRDRRAEIIPITDLARRDGATRFNGLVTGIRVPLPLQGTTRRLVYDRSLRPALSVALQIDYKGDAVIAARSVLGGCHSWPVTRDLAIQGMTLSAVPAAADDLATQTFQDAPPMTVPWFGAPHYRECMAPVLLARLLREVAR